MVAFSSLSRKHVYLLPPDDADRRHWLAHRGSGKGQWVKCERCNFAEHKAKLLASADFVLAPGLPAAGSWLESADGVDGSWRLRCVLCNTSLGPTRYRQVGRHAKSLRHRKALKSLNLPSSADPEFECAQSADSFQVLLEHARTSPLGENMDLVRNVGGRHKQRRMLWCLAEALRIQQREFLMQCGSMAIYQDARSSFLLDRWSASDAKLNCKFGHLWGTKLLESHSLDASGLQQATLDGLKNMCTVRLKPPRLSKGQQRWSGGTLNDNLLQHLRQIIEVFAADSAADEISAGQMLQRKGLIPSLQAMGLPNLRHVVRDKAHCSRRIDRLGRSVGGLMGDGLNLLNSSLIGGGLVGGGLIDGGLMGVFGFMGGGPTGGGLVGWWVNGWWWVNGLWVIWGGGSIR